MFKALSITILGVSAALTLLGAQPKDPPSDSKPAEALEKPAVAEKKKEKQNRKKKKNKKKKNRQAAEGGDKKIPAPTPDPAAVKFEAKPAPKTLTLSKGARVALIGGGLGSRMNHFGHFETELFLRCPDSDLTVRNLCDEGNTPGFRPHPGRNYDGQYAYPSAKTLVNPAYQVHSKPGGHFETPDQWLARVKADVIIGFFGYNSSFEGKEGLERYKKELEGFVQHALSRKYNGKGIPQLALVSPTAFQDLSAKYDTPDGKMENANLALYTEAMREVAAKNGALFVDVFTPSKAWCADGAEYTGDGALLNDKGYRKLAPVLADGLLGKASGGADAAKKKAVHAAVTDKNWAWLNDYKIPNGVHAFGRRYSPYGPANYPFELTKAREMTVIRDQAIWAALRGEAFDVAAADAKTSKLPPVKTSYRPSEKTGVPEYSPGPESNKKIQTAPGYKMELFASEEMFPDLANPVQLSFDNKGRLWVATMASYPHYRIGDPAPKDKLLILEDTDGDFKADKQTVFAGDLHIPIGFEISHDGVYVSQSGSLVFLKDTDGDDKYDEKEILYSGFDDHDTHHAISAFCADPSGAVLMAEGLFSHSNVETAYGPVRGTNGGFYRYSPQRKKLIRYAQYSIPNPWGIAFDDYGQDFFLQTSNTNFSWMAPGTVKSRYGANMKAPSLLTSNTVRPTSGLEFISSSHFPDAVQGDVLLCNSIGFLGAKQHQVLEDGTGFTTKFRQNLFQSKDGNFRPVDLEFAPDGSLYVVDWHNVLIGHMQHNARDPYRDHVHGRIYRVTYPERPLVKPPKIAGAAIGELLDNLKLPEYRARYRTRRELRGRGADKVLPELKTWVAGLDKAGAKYEHHCLEALWVSWGLNKVDEALLRDLLKAKDHRVRASAVRVLRFNPRIADSAALLMAAANDEHGRVRLEAIAGASWLDKEVGLPIVEAAKAKGLDAVSENSYKYAVGTLKNEVVVPARKKTRAPRHLKGPARKLYIAGASIYEKEGHCGTCHQHKGEGLPDVGFPPLAGTKWVLGDPERLIKLSLKGLMGPIEVQGKKYPGQVPMTAFEGMLDDKEMAAVLTYVRNSFGNKADAVTPEQVKEVRDALKGKKQGFYTPDELLKEHPHP